MSIDILLSNFAVVDFRRNDFDFVSKLVSFGGIVCSETEQMPDFSQAMYSEWIKNGQATAGGLANSAPLMSKAGLKVAIDTNLGKGDFGGLDAQGRFFYDQMVHYGIDMSQVYVHPELPTATAFIHDVPQSDRQGIATFPNAVNDIDFERSKKIIEKLEPKIVYYMYSGLSKNGDANNGRDLAEFIGWANKRGIITIVDNVTLVSNPQQSIKNYKAVEQYKLLTLLLPVVDVFFTSSDESKLIGNTLFDRKQWYDFSDRDHKVFLDLIAEKFWQNSSSRTKLFGVTVKDGACQKYCTAAGFSDSKKINSKFIASGDINLIGAGDSFRSGVISYIAHNLDDFKAGTIDFSQAVQMGNLFASVYIKNPVSDRFRGFGSFEKLLDIIKTTMLK